MRDSLDVRMNVDVVAADAEMDWGMHEQEWPMLPSVQSRTRLSSRPLWILPMGTTLHWGGRTAQRGMSAQQLDELQRVGKLGSRG